MSLGEKRREEWDIEEEPVGVGSGEGGRSGG